MFNSNLRFPFPSFFFLDRCRFLLNLTFLDESVFSFFFFLIAYLVESVVFLISYFLVFFFKFPPQGWYIQLWSSNSNLTMKNGTTGKKKTITFITWYSRCITCLLTWNQSRIGIFLHLGHQFVFVNILKSPITHWKSAKICIYNSPSCPIDMTFYGIQIFCKRLRYFAPYINAKFILQVS